MCGNKAVAGGGDTVTQLLRLEQPDYGIGESLGGVTDENFLTIDSTQRGIGKRSGNARLLHSHCLEKFILQSGTYAHGRHENLRRSIGLTNVVQTPADSDTLGSQSTNHGFGIGTSEEQRGFRMVPPNNGHHLTHQIAGGINIRSIGHIAAEDEIAR